MVPNDKLSPDRNGNGLDARGEGQRDLILSWIEAMLQRVRSGGDIQLSLGYCDISLTAHDGDLRLKLATDERVPLPHTSDVASFMEIVRMVAPGQPVIFANETTQELAVVPRYGQFLNQGRQQGTEVITERLSTYRPIICDVAPHPLWSQARSALGRWQSVSEFQEWMVEASALVLDRRKLLDMVELGDEEDHDLEPSPEQVAAKAQNLRNRLWARMAGARKVDGRMLPAHAASEEAANEPSDTKPIKVASDRALFDRARLKRLLRNYQRLEGAGGDAAPPTLRPVVADRAELPAAVVLSVPVFTGDLPRPILANLEERRGKDDRIELRIDPSLSIAKIENEAFRAIAMKLRQDTQVPVVFGTLTGEPADIHEFAARPARP